LGVIRSDLAVALSLSVTHKALGFDRQMPTVDFATLDLPSTGTLPTAKEQDAPGSARPPSGPQKKKPHLAAHGPGNNDDAQRACGTLSPLRVERPKDQQHNEIW